MLIKFYPRLQFKKTSFRVSSLKDIRRLLEDYNYSDYSTNCDTDDSKNRGIENIWLDIYESLYNGSFSSWLERQNSCEGIKNQIDDILSEQYVLKYQLLKKFSKILFTNAVPENVKKYLNYKIAEEKNGNEQKGIIGTSFNKFDVKKNYVFKISNNVKIPMVLVKGGTFKMGNNEDNFLDERPVHDVKLNDFWIGKYPITQGQWNAIASDIKREEENKFKNIHHPVENVTWNEVQYFCERLKRYAPEGYRFDLPTEAQWEFAAKGGNYSKKYKYSGSNILAEVAWYYENSAKVYWDDMKYNSDKLYIKDENKLPVPQNGFTTHPVGMKMPNELGIHDMSGNVSEWCRDCCKWDNRNRTVKTPTYNDFIYDSGYAFEPYCAIGEQRIRRGGSWANSSKFGCGTTNRQCRPPHYQAPWIGFRIVLVDDK